MPEQSGQTGRTRSDGSSGRGGKTKTGKKAGAKAKARADADLAGMPQELYDLAVHTARESRAYLGAVREIASGAAADTAIPVLLLAVSEILVTGARLGAIVDVVPAERFEADSGPDLDVDPLRHGMAEVFEGLDEYADLVDPLTSLELSRGSLAGDVTDIASALLHGLRHFDQGRISEALWWWQFSYLSTWGERAASTLRVLLRVLGHLRLDADDDVVSAAEFDALHP